jgi:hypothetical protein
MRSLLLVLALFSTVAVSAADFSGIELFIPITSRVPGANSTQWRTDLVISNRSETEVTTVKIVYRPTGGTPSQSSITLEPRATETIADVLPEMFGRDNTYGTLWLGSLNEQAKIVAHARIYNVGNAAGQFGQVVQGLPIAGLSKRIWLNGITGIGGNRTNIGIANPNTALAKFTINWYDRLGHLRGTWKDLTVDDWNVRIFNDIVAQINSGVDQGFAIRIVSDMPLYAYASVVRNDTGDAYTIIGNGSDDD